MPDKICLQVWSADLFDKSWHPIMHARAPCLGQLRHMHLEPFCLQLFFKPRKPPFVWCPIPPMDYKYALDHIKILALKNLVVPGFLKLLCCRLGFGILFLAALYRGLDGREVHRRCLLYLFLGNRNHGNNLSRVDGKLGRLGEIKVADLYLVLQSCELGNVDHDVLGQVRRLQSKLELVHDFGKYAPQLLNRRRDALELKRYRHCYLLALLYRIKVGMYWLVADRVKGHIVDKRLLVATQALKRYNGGLARLFKNLAKGLGVYGDRSRLLGAAVDDRRQDALEAEGVRVLRLIALLYRKFHI